MGLGPYKDPEGNRGSRKFLWVIVVFLCTVNDPKVAKKRVPEP